MTKLLTKPKGEILVSEPYESLHPSDSWFRCNVCLMNYSADLAGDCMMAFIGHDRQLIPGEDELFELLKVHICIECMRYIHQYIDSKTKC